MLVFPSKYFKHLLLEEIGNFLMSNPNQPFPACRNFVSALEIREIAFILSIFKCNYYKLVDATKNCH